MNPDETTDDTTSTGRGAAAAAVDRLAQTGRETYRDVKGRAVDAASRTASAAKAEAMDRAETAKDTIADEGRRLADSLRSASQGGDDSVQAKVLNVVADSVSDLSESLRGRSFEELMTQAQGFARRNPGAFVAAAALAGFAIARFARASTPEPDAPAEGFGAVSYGSAGYAGGVSTSSLTTHDDGFGDDDMTGDAMASAGGPDGSFGGDRAGGSGAL